MNSENHKEATAISRRKLLGGMAAGGAAVALGAVAGPAGTTPVTAFDPEA